MSQIKLSISWFSRLILLSILVSSCSSLYNHQLMDSVYIKNIPELDGMLLKHHLLTFFPKTNEQDTNYTISISLTKTEDLSLNNQSGFATKGNITYKVATTIFDSVSNSMIRSFTQTYSDTYNIEQTGTGTRNSYNSAQNALLEYIADELAIQIMALINQETYKS